jgi:large subunit ribosomal protein L9
MEIILTQDVDKIGKTGSVMKVKDGFARNFLFPRNLAIPATPANLKRIEQEAKMVANLRQQQKEKAETLCERLNGISITVPAVTHDEEKLYGSVSSADIIEALNQEGISEFTKEAVVLDEPIKSIGVYDVTIRLHPEVSAKIKVWVVKK